MKLLKTVIFVFMVCGFCFAQGKVSPVIAMTWDWDNEANTTTAGERFGLQASIDGDRSYGIDTNGTDHRTFFCLEIYQVRYWCHRHRDALYNRSDLQCGW